MYFPLSVLQTTSTDKYSYQEAYGRTFIRKGYNNIGFDVHLKSYFPKDYMIDTAEYIKTIQSILDYDIGIFKTPVGCSSVIIYYTDIKLSNGARFFIKFFWAESIYSEGFVKIFTGNEDFLDGIPMEQIRSNSYHDYNEAYEMYQSLCDKALTF